MKYFMLLLSLFAVSCNETKEHNAGSTVTINSTRAADTMTATIPPVPEDKVAGIRKEVQRINNMKLLVKSFNWKEEGCVDEGKVNYYFNNDTIVKVTESGFIGDGGWTKEYYYSNGKFIFSFMQHIGGPAGMPIDTSEIRMYADNDTLVLQKRNNDSFDDVSKKFNSNAVEYRILEAYKDKNFAAVFCR